MKVYIEDRSDFSEEFIEALFDIFPGITISYDKDKSADIFIIKLKDKMEILKDGSFADDYISTSGQHVIAYNKNFKDSIIFNNFADCVTNDEEFIIEALKEYAPQYLQEFVD